MTLLAASPPNAQALKSVLHRVARRYKGGSPFTRGYVGTKLRTDPLHLAVLAIAAREPFGDVIDIGCGFAQLDVALLEAQLARSALGLDINSRHLDEAVRAATGLAFQAEQRDFAIHSAIPPGDTILIMDVLHLLKTDDQARLLHEATGSARKRILLRTLDPDRGWRSLLTRGLETLGRRIWPNAGTQVNPRPVAWLSKQLQMQGFEVEVVPCWSGTPFASVLLVARRAEENG
jgi:SAM-dependent methyltransferase